MRDAGVAVPSSENDMWSFYHLAGHPSRVLIVLQNANRFEATSPYVECIMADLLPYRLGIESAFFHILNEFFKDSVRPPFSTNSEEPRFDAEQKIHDRMHMVLFLLIKML